MKLNGEHIVQHCDKVAFILLVAGMLAKSAGFKDVALCLSSTGLIICAGYFYLRSKGFGEY